MLPGNTYILEPAQSACTTLRRVGLYLFRITIVFILFFSILLSSLLPVLLALSHMPARLFRHTLHARNPLNPRPLTLISHWLHLYIHICMRDLVFFMTKAECYVLLDNTCSGICISFYLSFLLNLLEVYLSINLHICPCIYFLQV